MNGEVSWNAVAVEIPRASAPNCRIRILLWYGNEVSSHTSMMAQIGDRRLTLLPFDASERRTFDEI